MTELEKSLIEWVNANNTTKLVTDMIDLNDGVILYQLMKEVAPRQFQNISLTENDLNWSAKLRNLKQVFHGIEQFYEYELGIECDRIVQDLSLVNIARNQDTRELSKLMELVVGAAVSWEGKETYIERLSTLSETSQAQLMFFIEKVLEKFDYKKSEKEEKKETQKLRHWNRKIAIELQEVQDELALLEINHTTVTKERDELRVKSEELEKNMPQKNVPSFDCELDQEYESQIRKKDAEWLRIAAKLTEAQNEHLEEVSKLKDELDVANERILKLSEVQETLELYKKRMSDDDYQKKKIKDLGGINEQLKERLHRLEEDQSGMDNVKKQAKFYKEQLTQEKEKFAQVTLDFEAAVGTLEELKKLHMKTNESLEFSQRKNKKLTKEVEKLHIQIQNQSVFNIENSLAAFPDEQDERLRILEAENYELRMNDPSSLVEDLNAQIDVLIKEKSLLKSRLESSEGEKVKAGADTERLTNALQILEGKLAAVEQNSDSKISRREMTINTLRSKVYELQINTEQTQEELEAARAEVLQTNVVTPKEFQNLQRTLGETQMQLDKKKGALSKAQLQEEKLKVQGRTLKQQVSELTSSISDMSRCLKDKDAELEKLRKRSGTSSDKNEVHKLKNLLATKEQEINFHIKTKEEIENARNKELKLMTTVLHEIGLDLYKVNRNSEE